MYYVYIMTSKENTAVYIGITNDLRRRVYEHENETIKGYTSKYKVKKLVYYEVYSTAYEAIAREKQLKGWSRLKKNVLIESMNPEWKKLNDDIKW